MKKAPLEVSLDPELVRWVERQARENRRSVSDVVAGLIRTRGGYDGTAVDLERIETAQIELMKRFQDYLELARNREGNPDRLHHALLEEGAALQNALSRLVQEGADPSRLMRALNAQAILMAMETNLHRFAVAVEGAEHSEAIGTLIGNLIEGLDALLFCATDAFDGSHPELTMVLEMSGDRGDLMERLRRNYRDATVGPEDGPMLFYTTTLFERTVWLLHRFASIYAGPPSDERTPEGSVERLVRKLDRSNFIFEGEQMALQQQRQEAQLRAKDSFLANMSHEIRTPLNAILGFTDLLKRDGTLSAEHRQSLQTIHSNGSHLLALLNDLLAMAKLEAGHETCNEETFDPRAMLNDSSLLFTRRAHDKDIALVVDIAADLPSRVIGDPVKIRQILSNLLSNAVKFTQRGVVTLKAVYSEGELIVEVADTGSGISDEERDLVFQLFEQTASGRRSGGGTGLGMTLSRRYAELMGGQLTFQSLVDRGTTFKLQLPTPLAEGGTPSSPEAAPPSRRGDLRSLPEPLRTDLSEAAHDGDHRRLLELQEALHELEPAMVQRVAELIDNFEYRKLASLLGSQG